MPIRMTKPNMKERIKDAFAGGDDKAIRQRVQLCLHGLRTVRTGHVWANELIDELGLEKYGAHKTVPPDESVRSRRKQISK